MSPSADRDALIKDILSNEIVSFNISTVQVASNKTKQLNDIVQKLVLWSLFNVLVALSPFIFRALGIKFLGQNVVWGNVFADGELLLVAAAVASGAIGEIIVSDKQYRTPKLIVGGLCIFILIIASLCYAFIKALGNSTITLEVGAIYSWSVWIFLGAFLTGAGSIILSEVK